MSQGGADSEQAGREASDRLCHILSALRPLCGWPWGHIHDNTYGDFHALIIGNVADNWTGVRARGESPQRWGLTGKDDTAARNGQHPSVNMRQESLLTPKVEVKPKYFVVFTLLDLVSMLKHPQFTFFCLETWPQGAKAVLSYPEFKSFVFLRLRTHHYCYNSSRQPKAGLTFQRLGQGAGLRVDAPVAQLWPQQAGSSLVHSAIVTSHVFPDRWPSPRVPAHLNNTGMRLATKTRCWELLK